MGPVIKNSRPNYHSEKKKWSLICFSGPSKPAHPQCLCQCPFYNLSNEATMNWLPWIHHWQYHISVKIIIGKSYQQVPRLPSILFSPIFSSFSSYQHAHTIQAYSPSYFFSWTRHFLTPSYALVSDFIQPSHITPHHYPHYHFNSCKSHFSIPQTYVTSFHFILQHSTAMYQTRKHDSYYGSRWPKGI